MKGTHTGRNGVRQRQRWLIAALLVVTGVFAFAGTAGATTDGGSSTSTAPWIISDQADYAPGSTVHLTGGDWQPGEAVQIVTNDSVGNAWRQTDNVTADASGNIADDVVLPNTFIASYTVTATGAVSGTATATFTDGNVTSVSGTVTDSSGTHAPISGATVTCNTAGGCNATFSTTTNASGNYVFDNSTSKLSFGGNGPTTLTLTVTKTGYTSGTITLSNVNNGDTFTGKNGQLTPAIQNQATLSITGPSSATFGAADATITTSGGSGTGALSFGAGSSTACSIVNGKLHVLSGTGSCTITATKAGDSNFNPTTSAPFTVTINKAEQATLAITAPSDATFGHADYDITTTGGSGSGTLSVSVTNGTDCTIAAGKLHVVHGSGTCKITAHQNGDADYNPTNSAEFTVNLQKAEQATLAITAPSDATFGHADYDITTTGGSGSGTLSVSVTNGTDCTIAAGKLHVVHGSGTCKITAHQNGDADYNPTNSAEFTVNLQKAEQATLAITAPSDATFGHADYDITTTGGSGSGTLSVSVTNGTDCTIAAGKLHVVHGSGTCKITAHQNGDADYNPTNSAEFTVNLQKAEQATLAITAPSDATFGHADYDITTTGGSGSGTLSVSVTNGTDCTIAAGKLHVVHGSGTCKITAHQNGDADYNPTNSAEFTVNLQKAEQATLAITAPSDATFGHADYDITTTGGSGSGTLSVSVTNGTDCTIAAGKLHVVHGSGTCKITAHQNGDADYNPTNSAEFTVNLQKAEQATLAITAPSDATFGHADYDITTTGGSGSGTLSVSVTNGTDCTIAAGKLHVVHGSGTCKITAHQNGDADYNPTNSAEFTVNLQKAEQATLAITAPSDATFGHADYDITTTGGSGSGTLSVSVTNGTDCTIAAGKLHVVHGSGTCKITAHQNGDADYNPTNSAEFTVNLQKAEQATLAITAPSDATFGHADYDITTTGGSGSGTLSVSVTNGTDCTIAAGKLHVVHGSGTCKITAHQNGDADYNPTNSAEFTVNLQKAEQATLAITAPSDATFGHADYDITTTGGSGSGTLSVSVTNGTDCTIAAGKLHVVHGSGTCKITAHQNGDADYNPTNSAEFTVNLQKAEQATLAITAPSDATFGHADYDITTTGGSGSGTLSVSVTNGTDCTIAAGKLHVVHGSGTCKITAHQNGDADYNPTNSAEFTVNLQKAEQATLAITAPSDATFGHADYDITTTGGSGSGTLSVSVTNGTDCTIAAGKLHVVHGSGTCKITAHQNGDADYNPTNSAEFTVNLQKAEQATLAITAPSDATFGHADYDITTTGGSGSGTLSVSVTNGTDCTIAAGKLHVVHGSGTCKITAHQNGDADYNPTNSAEFTVNLQKAEQATLAITAPSDATFGHADYDITTTGGSGSGTLSVSVTNGTDCTIAAGKLHVVHGSGTCKITAHQNGDADYNPTNSAEFTVNLQKADQVVTFTSTAPTSAILGSTYKPTASGGGSGNPVTFSATGGCTYDSGSGLVTMTSVLSPCVVAASQAGNGDYLQGSNSQTFGVIYSWTGFFQPVNNPTDTQPWNSAKAGSAIPVKFNLGGSQGLNIFLTIPTSYPKITQIQCPNSSVVPDPIETYLTTTAGGSTLTYDTTAMQYIYAWKTDKTWGGKCFTFQLGLNDGSTHNFWVQFIK